MFWLLAPALAAQVSIHVIAGWREEWCKLSTEHLLEWLRRGSYDLKMESWLPSGSASFCHSPHTQTNFQLSPNFTCFHLYNNWHFSGIFLLFFKDLFWYFIYFESKKINKFATQTWSSVNWSCVTGGKLASSYQTKRLGSFLGQFNIRFWGSWKI